MNILDKKYKNKSGIYKIVNLINNKIYIGSTIDLRRRSINHRSCLKNGNSHSLYLQRAINKYGIDNFRIEVIKLIDDISLVREFEEFYINFFDSVNNGYNAHSRVVANDYLAESSKVSILCYDLEGNFIIEFKSIVEACNVTGYSNVGVYDVCMGYVGKCNDYIFRYKKNKNFPLKIKKYIHGNTGIIRTEEEKEKNRLAHLGKKHSEETKRKMNESLRGREMTKKQLEVGFDNIINYIKPKTPVVQIDKNSDKILMEFDSMWAACIYLGKKNRGGDIHAVCNGNQKTAFGYKWRYKKELVNN